MEALDVQWSTSPGPDPIEILRPHFDVDCDESTTWCRSHLCTLLAAALGTTSLPPDASSTAVDATAALCTLIDADYSPAERAELLSLVTFSAPPSFATIPTSRTALGTAIWVPDTAVLFASLLIRYVQPAFTHERRWRHIVCSRPRLELLASWMERLIDFEENATAFSPPVAGTTLARFAIVLNTTDYVGAMARLLTLYRDDWQEFWTG